MPNTYFNLASPITRFTTADAIRLNNILKAVEAGFDKLPSSDELNQGSRNFAIATGTANTYSVTVPFALTSYQAGLSVNALIMIANTGPSTLNVNGIGQATIKRADGTNLVQGDIRASSLSNFIYDGTAFRLTSFHGASEAITAAHAATATTAASAAAASQSAAAISANSAATSASSAQSSSVAATATLASARFGWRNILINNLFWVDQRNPGVFSGVNTTGWVRDRWYGWGCTWSIANAILTIASGALTQVVQGRNVPLPGKYTLSWIGTAGAAIYPIQGQPTRIVVPNGGSIDLAGFQNCTVEFFGGTVHLPQLEYGSAKTSPEVRSVDLERELCFQYYQKTYPANIAPGSIVQISTVPVFNTGVTTASRNHFAATTAVLNETFFTFPTIMRATPTITIYNLKGVAGSVSNITKTIAQGVHVTHVPNVEGIYDQGFSMWFPGSLPLNDDIRLHYAANAEL